MATAAENKAVISSLISASNAATGNNDADLSTAVQALIEGFGAGSGGSLAIKRGTVTLSTSYTPLNIEHGCKKVPIAVFVYPIDEYTITLNNLTGGFWHRDSYAGLFKASTDLLINVIISPYHVPTGTVNAYALYVDATKISCNPSARWMAATYQWIAIYEV